MNISKLSPALTRHKALSKSTAIWRRTGSQGFTVIELLIAIAIVVTLASMAYFMYLGNLEKARTYAAIQTLTQMSTELQDYGIDSGTYPQSLNDLGYGGLLDPWGNSYQYLNIATANVGVMRKDRFLVPINTDFDLYSMGKDGDTRPPLNVPVSRDDIIRANDGQYIGRADGF